MTTTTETGFHPDELRQARGKFLAMAGSYSMGVFNDNFFKQAACLLALRAGLPELQGVAAVLFALPFILLAAPAGYFADRFPKRHVVIASKVLELAAMICGALGMCLGSWTLMLVMIFVMGVQATIFSPALNGSIPELYPVGYVLKANSFMKMIVTVAILLGTICACLAIGVGGNGWLGVTPGRLIVSAVAVAAATLGLVMSLGVASRPAANPSAKFPWTGPVDTVRALWRARTDTALAAVIGLDAFVWFVAALQIQLINQLGVMQLKIADSAVVFLLVPELGGVGLGGLIAGRLGDGHLWRRLLAPAALGMGLIMMLITALPLLPGAESSHWQLAGLSPQVWAACVLLFGTGLTGGILLVPLEAFIQTRPAADRKGQVIAAANFTAFIGIALSGVVYVGLCRPMSAANAFGLLGVLTVVVGMGVWAWARRRIHA